MPIQTLFCTPLVAVQTLFLLVTDAAPFIFCCWSGDIFKLRADSGFAAEDRQILGLLSPPHDRPPTPLGTPPVTNQQESYAHVLRTGVTTGTLNTICVQECGLPGTVCGSCRPEMLVGTDVALSMFVAVIRPLAMIVLLSTLGQAHRE